MSLPERSSGFGFIHPELIARLTGPTPLTPKEQFPFKSPRLGPHFLAAYNAGIAGAFWGAAVLFGDNDSSVLAFGVRLYLPQRGEHSQVEEETPIILCAAVFMPEIEGVQLGVQNRRCCTAVGVKLGLHTGEAE